MKFSNLIFVLAVFFVSAALLVTPLGQAQAQVKASGLDIRGAVGDNAPDEMVDAAGAKRFYQNCSGHLPIGFTPSTRDDFCTCASVSVTQIMTNGELAAVLDVRKKADRYYDMSLIKYVEGVVSPCLENPVRTLGYITCLEERAHDHRIRSFPAYCSCAADIASRMMRDRGSRDMIAHFTGMERNTELRPVESFITSPAYRNYVKTGMHACVQPVYMEWR
tara:strand:+ start:22723 stop:23382 length:660 start_codon:yes stop_codon:yes gene_type:complete